MQLQHPDYQRITINPEVCFGKPCIRGMRFPVSTLLGYLASGMSMEELITDFPFLEKADILEALAFASRTMDEKMLPLKQARA
ncbi:MAG: DUF433 domain-containing protein [Saprospiraceae bacterium]|nr:DUF433 domain-containing protein [Saprospiraceae bacterium]